MTLPLKRLHPSLTQDADLLAAHKDGGPIFNAKPKAKRGTDPKYIRHKENEVAKLYSKCVPRWLCRFHDSRVFRCEIETTHADDRAWIFYFEGKPGVTAIAKTATEADELAKAVMSGDRQPDPRTAALASQNPSV
jgi:hypothetical protein